MDATDTSGFLTFRAGELAESKREILSELKRVGFVAVSGVPGLEGSYERLLGAARRLIELPPETLAACSPLDFYIRGWARGRDRNGGMKLDTYKGSYYARIPDVPNLPQNPGNLWPTQVPEFQPAFLELGDVVADAAKELLPLVGIDGGASALGRLLHYRAVTPGEDDDNPDWCGRHRDGWLLTGLCSEAFYEGGLPRVRPPGSGLYIENVAVSVPRDTIIFQVGAYLEALTEGRVFASDHWVRKAPPGIERYSFAVFLNDP